MIENNKIGQMSSGVQVVRIQSLPDLFNNLL